MSIRRVFGTISFFLVVLSFFLIFQYIGVPSPASAHGAYNTRYPAGNYFIEVGTEDESLYQNDFTRINLNLLLATTSEKEVEIPHTTIWVRLEHGERILWSTWLSKPEGLLAGFSYTFPEAGEYVLRARFLLGTTTLAEAPVPIFIVGDGISQSHLGVFFGGILIGGILIFLVGRQRLFPS